VANTASSGLLADVAKAPTTVACMPFAGAVAETTTSCLPVDWVATKTATSSLPADVTGDPATAAGLIVDSVCTTDTVADYMPAYGTGATA